MTDHSARRRASVTGPCRGARQDRGIPFGEERTEPQILRMRGRSTKRSASRVWRPGRFPWGEMPPVLCLGGPPLLAEKVSKQSEFLDSEVKGCSGAAQFVAWLGGALADDMACLTIG